jgi:hypothetical protein
MKNRWIDIIIIGILICCVVAFIQIYYNMRYKECISNPLTYAARQLEERYGKPFQGSGAFIMEGTSPIIYFNRYNITVDNPNIMR